MPYIPDVAKERVMKYGATNAGELNYQLTQTVLDYLSRKRINYQTLNEVMGVLESCKEEFYARKVRPYEDNKIAENGDVYSGNNL